MAGKGTKPTYEEAREELAGVVSALEKGGLTLEESLALWERGEELASICEKWLHSALEKVDGTSDEPAE